MDAVTLGMAKSHGRRAFSPLLFDITLSADTPAIAINNIPAGYGELLIVAQVRATNASTNTQLRMCINNDVLQSNYVSQRLRATSTTVDAANISASPYFQVADITGGTAAESVAGGVVDIRLSNYDGTAFQQEFVSDYHYSFGTSASQYVGKYAGRYLGAAGAVESVLLFAASGNLKAGSRVTVYGRNQGSPVLAVPSLFQTVHEGDSLTASATGGGTNYPIHLSPKLSATIMANVATAGEATADVISQASAQVDAIFKAGITNILLPWVGTNDLTLTSDTGDVIYGRYSAYCAARRTAGYKVVAFTLLPRLGLSGPQQTALTLFNTSVRANWATFADVLHDVAAISQFSDASNATYYADGLHLTDAGREINATAIASLLHSTFGVPLA